LFAAAPALTEEFQEVAVYLKAGLFGQLSFQSAEVAFGKIHDFAAIGTNQVMVVFGGSPHHIAPAPALGVDPAHQIEFA
jgi:hypothetical protein